MDIIMEYQGSNSSLQLVRLKNKSFCMYIATRADIKHSFFTKYEEKEAREFFELLKNINY
jgi:hypothetical protein